MLKQNNLILFALYAFWMEIKEEMRCGKRTLCRVHKKKNEDVEHRWLGSCSLSASHWYAV